MKEAGVNCDKSLSQQTPSVDYTCKVGIFRLVMGEFYENFSMSDLITNLEACE